MRKLRLSSGFIFAMGIGLGALVILITVKPAVVYGQSGATAGGKIAFTTNRDGKAQVYAMNPDGTNQVNLSKNAFNDTQPAWSPDGSRIAFVSDRDGNNEICLMSADGSGQHCLTNNKTASGHFERNQAEDDVPSWSPDGQQITFYSTRDGNPEIYVMNADGSTQHNISHNPSDDLFPAWQWAGTGSTSGTSTLQVCASATPTMTWTRRFVTRTFTPTPTNIPTSTKKPKPTKTQERSDSGGSGQATTLPQPGGN